ncbi:MAG TPA: tRNA (adenosine(37)-N6)-threonylcarbamoyltransferase complex dimerization subunit type 1 TsaB [bacterium]|nr:tRNA (adenosine(37)-N6)-threonylcarbamoyltransferase complex dimerization subunit type 1 TsaB [bacterium]
MRILGIETATPLASCAVVDGSGVLAEATLRAPMRHLEWLAPAIAEMLRGLGMRPAELEGIAVSRGPGGFTGLRIGIATAVSWARARRTPVLGVDTLEALALAAGGPAVVLAALDAHRGEVAAGLYHVSAAGAPRCLVAPIVAPPDVVAAEVAAALDGAPGWVEDPHGCGDAYRRPGVEGPVLVVGDALARHERALLAGLAGRGVAGGPHIHPRAAAVALLGRLRLLAGVRDDPDTLLPIYGRRPALREWQETPAQPGNG